MEDLMERIQNSRRLQVVIAVVFLIAYTFTMLHITGFFGDDWSTLTEEDITIQPGEYHETEVPLDGDCNVARVETVAASNDTEYKVMYLHQSKAKTFKKIMSVGGFITGASVDEITVSKYEYKGDSSTSRRHNFERENAVDFHNKYYLLVSNPGDTEKPVNIHIQVERKC